MNNLINELKAGQRVLLVGPPGCGKTARIRAAAKSCGRRLVTVRASLSERVDFGGCLVPDQAAGVTRALPLELLRDLQTTNESTLLFLDDLGQAPIDVQAALMRLFDEGELSPSVLIWGATNRPGDKAGVTALCEPLRSRFDAAYIIPTPGCENKPDGGVLLGDWTDELSAWIDWAFEAGAPAEIVAWHRSTNGKSLYAWRPHADPAVRMPDYRSWGTLITRWAAGLRSLDQCAAVLGKPAAAEFLAFASLADKLPSPDQVWLDPDGALVPSDASAQWLITTTLGRMATESTAPALIRYLSRLPRTMTALGARDAYRRLGAKLSGCREWVRWFNENQALFQV